MVKNIKTLTDYYQIYQKEIFPILVKEEYNRKKILKYIILRRTSIFLLSVLLSTIIIYFLMPNILHNGHTSTYIIMCLFFSVIFTICFLVQEIINPTEKQFQNNLETKYINKYLEPWGNIKKNNDIIDNLEIDIDNSNLFSEYDFRDTDDQFEGEYNNIKFIISEEKLYKTINNSQTTRSVFKGCFILFKTNKFINNKTVIINKKSKRKDNISKIIHFILSIILVLPLFLLLLLSSSFLLLIILILLGKAILAYFDFFHKRNSSNEKLKKMNLEDLKFNNMFASYSSSEVEGRYAITPALMERLLNLKLAFKAKNISASFFEDKLLIAIETNKDLFEIGDLWHPLTDIKYANNFFDEMSSILKMIDYLKLNENTKL